MSKPGYTQTKEHKANIGKARLASKKIFRYPRAIKVCKAPGCENTFEARIGAPNEKQYCCIPHCHLGKPSPLRGRTKETDVSIAKMAKTLTGRKQLEETNKKRSETLKGKTYVELYGPEKAVEMIETRSGENCNFWQGGVELAYPKEFWRVRLTIKERDNFECQLCGKTEVEEIVEIGRGLPVHHINSIKEDNREENLITLCCSCHGKMNTNTEFWESFFYWKLKLPQMFYS